MPSLWLFNTYHEEDKKNSSAEAWKKEGVCAIGYYDIGNLKDQDINNLPKACRDFLKIEKNDIILSYIGNGCIAYVGRIIDGNYSYNTNNLVGMLSEKGGFEYPNQYKVEWFNEPHHFHKIDLPGRIQIQIKGRQPIINFVLTPFRSFESVIKDILSAPSNTCTDILPENLVKSGIRSYIQRNKTIFEPGIFITHIEKGERKGRPDFVANDKDENLVLIECKGNANETDCEQLLDYLKLKRFDQVSINARTRARKKRLFLVAFDFSPNCIEIAKKNNIELFKCEVKFPKVDL